MPFGGCAISNHSSGGGMSDYDDRRSLCKLSSIKEELTKCMDAKDQEYERLTGLSKWMSDYPGQKKKVEPFISEMNASNNPERKINTLRQYALDYCKIYNRGSIYAILAKAYYQLGRGVEMTEVNKNKITL